MKTRMSSRTYWLWASILFSVKAWATTYYVAVNSPNPVSPYTSWATAATNIQDAVDVSANGDMVLVTNGIYQTGGRMVLNAPPTNRVAVTKIITLMSVNGPAVTAIRGYQMPGTTNGADAIRCIFLTNGATLAGFTLTNGGTYYYPPGGLWNEGGGVFCQSTNAMSPVSSAVVSNCWLVGNSSFGVDVAYGGILNDCILSGNSGGGASYCILNNCTVVSNSSSFVAGAHFSTANNCILYFNNAPYEYWGSTLNYCCTTPSPGGTGNITNDPMFTDAAFHLSAASPCRGAGSSLYATGTDMDGEAWKNPPSMGADEVYDADFIGALSVAIQASQTNLLVNRSLALAGLITGRASGLEWSFGDGTIVSNVSYFTSHVWTNAGKYSVVFTAYNTDNPGGVSANLLVQVLPLNPPLIQPGSFSLSSTNGFQFQFSGQSNAVYTVQVTTNLVPPVVWQTLQTITGTGGAVQVTDANATNRTSFYRVGAQ
jgi:hypothetical protein